MRLLADGLRKGEVGVLGERVNLPITYFTRHSLTCLPRNLYNSIKYEVQIRHLLYASLIFSASRVPSSHFYSSPLVSSHDVFSVVYSILWTLLYDSPAVFFSSVSFAAFVVIHLMCSLCSICCVLCVLCAVFLVFYMLCSLSFLWCVLCVSIDVLCCRWAGLENWDPRGGGGGPGTGLQLLIKGIVSPDEYFLKA